MFVLLGGAASDGVQPVRSMKLAAQAAATAPGAEPLLCIRDKTYARGCISAIYPDSVCSSVYFVCVCVCVCVGVCVCALCVYFVCCCADVIKRMRASALARYIPIRYFPLLSDALLFVGFRACCGGGLLFFIIINNSCSGFRTQQIPPY